MDKICLPDTLFSFLLPLKPGNVLIMNLKYPIFFLLSLFLFFFHSKTNAQVNREDRWVDSVFSSLTIEQRIAQLLIIRAYSDRDSVYNDSLYKLAGHWNVGGICFFKGTPRRQIEMTNAFQHAVQTPLLIATDAEWGAGMRLDSAFSFPKQMTLGAIANDSLIYEMASVIA
ncbi:MAG: glycoside hydrolase family 3 N-terminal domain-containing protein, partial [Bacteroidota bacterium]